MKKLEERTAVVTGAGRGIGEAIARELAMAGMRVALVDRDGAAVSRVAADLGGRAEAFAVDVSERAAVNTLADTVKGRLGPVAVLINNAGVSLSGRFTETSLDDLSWVMGVNFWGAV